MRKKISGNKNTCAVLAEVSDILVTFGLIHSTVKSRDSELFVYEVVFQLLNLLFGVAEDDALSNLGCFKELAENIEFVCFLFYSDVEDPQVFRKEQGF